MILRHGRREEPEEEKNKHKVGDQKKKGGENDKVVGSGELSKRPVGFNLFEEA